MRRLKNVPDGAWLALALGLRVIFALKLGERLYQIDERALDQAARGLASTGILGSAGRAAVLPPIPVGFFAFFYLFSHHILLPRLGQALISTTTVWALSRMVQDLSASRVAGRLALILGAVYPFFIYYSGMLLTETLYLACVVPGLWALCRCLRARGGAASAGGAGLLLSLAALCRVEAVPIALFLWLALAGLCAVRRFSWTTLSAALLCWLIPLAAWAARNKSVVGNYVLDVHGGITLLIGTEYFDLNEVDTSIAMKALEVTPLYKETLALPAADRDRIFTRTALEYMRGHPRATLTQWAKKFANFWRFCPRADKLYAKTAASDPSVGLKRWALILISLIFEPWIILGGSWGFWRLRERWDTLFPLAWFVLATMGVHVLSVSQMRYRLPVMPFLIFALFANVLSKGEHPDQIEGPR